MGSISTTATVYDRLGQPQQLGTAIASGGEGAVFALSARPDLLVKCFHPQRLKAHGAELRRKIEYMASVRQRFVALPLCWPTLPVYDKLGGWIGFAMKRAEGVPLSKLVHPKLGPRYVPELNRAHLVAMLLALVEAIGGLHDLGVCVGDINLNNFHFDHRTGKVALLDCDSYQVEADRQLFRCHVGTLDMLPPEHQSMDFSRIVRTPQSDLFSLAILVFKCFMATRHPYDAVQGGSTEENLRNGHFPYGQGGAAPGFAGAIPNGPWYVIWSHLTFELKSLLIRTLSDGARCPERRASIAEWRSALKKYAYALDHGVELALCPQTAKSSQYRGTRTDLHGLPGRVLAA